MAINQLTSLEVKTAKPRAKSYRLSDGGSLYLDMQPNGSKLWRYRYRIGGREAVLAIGAFPNVSLKAARSACESARELVRRGVHPVTDRKAKLAVQIESNVTTFEVVARRWIASKTDCSPNYVKQIERDFACYLFPKIGTLPLVSIKAPHLRPLLIATAEGGAECTAINLRLWLSQFFRYAAQYGLVDSDPAAFLKGLIKRPSVKHHSPLQMSEIPVLLHKLKDRGGYTTTRIAIRLMALTFTRTIEMRTALWADFNLETATWTIPAARMKMKRPHIVPLSAQAMELLRELHGITGSQKHLYPNYCGKVECMCATTINRALGRLGYEGLFSGHGFRSTATSALAALSYPAERVDLQLAHSKKSKDSSRAPCDHVRWLHSRRIIMQDWSDVLDGLENGVAIGAVFEKYGPTSSARQKLMKVVEVENLS